MLQSWVVRVAAAVVVTAAVAVPAVVEVTGHDDQARSARVEQTRSFEDRRGGHTEGDVDVGVGDDGFRLRMESRDGSTGASGSAGVSMTDDGFDLHLHSDGQEGRGGAGVSMTDEGMRLWFDVDESG